MRAGRIIPPAWNSEGSPRNTTDYAHKLATALTIGWRERDGLSGGDVRW